MPPAPAVFDKLLIDACAIGQDHISKGALVLVVAVRLDGDLFPEGELRGRVLGLLAVGLALVRIRTISGMLFVERCPI